MNVVAATGRLTGSPELKTVGAKDMPKVDFRIAIDNGEQDTTYINVEAWGNQAKAVADHKEKGDMVHVTGALRTSEWERDDGTMAYKTYINASQVEFGQRARANEPQSVEKDAVAQEAPAQEQAKEVEPEALSVG